MTSLLGGVNEAQWEHRDIVVPVSREPHGGLGGERLSERDEATADASDMTALYVSKIIHNLKRSLGMLQATGSDRSLTPVLRNLLSPSPSTS